MASIRQTLSTGAEQLGLPLDDATVDKLLAYQEQLLLWNKAYNLTAIREPEQVVVKHLLDSLSVLPKLHEGRLLDVGTGGGLPGMVIAITQPERELVLLDSNGKKIRFLTQAISDLKLPKVKAVQARIEGDDARQLGQFDVVTNRAFASLADIWRDCAPYVGSDGVVQAMKGQLQAGELSDFERLYPAVQREVSELVVPFLNEQRHLVTLAAKAA